MKNSRSVPVLGRSNMELSANLKFSRVLEKFTLLRPGRAHSFAFPRSLKIPLEGKR